MIPAEEYFDTLPARLDEVGGYFERVLDRVHARYGEEPPVSVDGLRLAFAEAITNAIRHGNGEGGAPVELTLTLDDGALALQVTDDGPGFEWPALDGVSLDLECESGRGVFLIHELMDEVEYVRESGRNTLRLVKQLRCERKAAEIESQKVRTVLVVDDDEETRFLLSHLASEYCDRVLTAPNAPEALVVIARNPELDAILLDVQMPGMSGLDLTRQIRGNDSRYVPILLVTGNGHIDDVVRGFEAGADDYIIKPPEKAELSARLRAAFRMRDAVERHRRSQAELADQLEDARRLQTQSLPPSSGRIGPLAFAAHYRPYRYVGGDVFNYFSLSDTVAGLFIADIAGHGVGAAMWSMWVSRMMSSGPSGLALDRKADGSVRVRSPGEVCHALDPMIGQEESEKYFTAFSAQIDHEGDTVTFCQAGHPAALLLRPDGTVERLESDSPPVGFELGLPYRDRTAPFGPGDRLFIYSDCVTETFSPDGTAFGEGRLVDLLVNSSTEPVEAQLSAVTAALDAHNHGVGLDDDLTLLGVEYLED